GSRPTWARRPSPRRRAARWRAGRASGAAAGGRGAARARWSLRPRRSAASGAGAAPERQEAHPEQQRGAGLRDELQGDVLGDQVAGLPALGVQEAGLDAALELRGEQLVALRE